MIRKYRKPVKSFVLINLTKEVVQTSVIALVIKKLDIKQGFEAMNKALKNQVEVLAKAA